jgi:hypothetical protein
MGAQPSYTPVSLKANKHNLTDEKIHEIISINLEKFAKLKSLDFSSCNLQYLLRHLKK